METIESIQKSGAKTPRDEDREIITRRSTATRLTARQRRVDF